MRRQWSERYEAGTPPAAHPLAQASAQLVAQPRLAPQVAGQRAACVDKVAPVAQPVSSARQQQRQTTPPADPSNRTFAHLWPTLWPSRATALSVTAASALQPPARPPAPAAGPRWPPGGPPQSPLRRRCHPAPPRRPAPRAPRFLAAAAAAARRHRRRVGRRRRPARSLRRHPPPLPRRCRHLLRPGAPAPARGLGAAAVARAGGRRLPSTAPQFLCRPAHGAQEGVGLWTNPAGALHPTLSLRAHARTCTRMPPTPTRRTHRPCQRVEHAEAVLKGRAAVAVHLPSHGHGHTQRCVHVVGGGTVRQVPGRQAVPGQGRWR